MPKTMTIFYCDGPKTVHHIPDTEFPVPIPNVIGHGAFVEVEDGVFVNTRDIERIEVKESI